MTGHLDFPLHFDSRGETARVGPDDYVRDLIRLVLFTNPGERVNRPDFGCGLKRAVFGANNEIVASTTRFLIQASLQRWLERVIEVRRVDVEHRDAQLEVTVVYTVIRTGELRKDRFVEAAP